MHTHPILSLPMNRLTDYVAALDKIINLSEACMSDRDLFGFMNDLLVEERQISYRTFQRYKARAMEYGDATTEEREEFDPQYRKLWTMFRRNSAGHKIQVYNAMMTCEGNQWIRHRWVLERKYSDFNLKYQTQLLLDEHRREQEMLYPGEEAKADVIDGPSMERANAFIAEIESLRPRYDPNYVKPDVAANGNGITPQPDVTQDDAILDPGAEDDGIDYCALIGPNRDIPNPMYANDPMYHPDGRKLTPAEFVQRYRERDAAHHLPDRALEPPTPAFKPAPYGVKKILGIA